MFAVQDQENLVHGHQTAAAAKPLNQGIKGYGAKTPSIKAPRTPFKVPLNDENTTFQAGKSILRTSGKGVENVFTKGKKGAEVDKSAFITPAGPRNRAPLGMKTTNARTKAFQTPVPLTIDNSTERTQQKSLSPRLRRAKVRVHQAEPTKDVPEDEERDIEYMPPRGEPLPDYPDDCPIREYPMFEGANLTRGMWSTYFDPVDEHGISRLERQEAEDDARYERMVDEMTRKAIEDLDLVSLDVSQYTGMESRQKREREAKPKKAGLAGKASKVLSKTPTAQGLSTIASKDAAAALSYSSRPPTSASTRGFAAPTASTKARAPSALVNRKTRPTPTPSNPSTMHHAAATAASRTTLGYSQGRAVSSTVRKPASAISDAKPKRSVTSPGAARSRAASSQAGGVQPARGAVIGMRQEPDVEDWLRMRGARVEGDEEGADDFVKNQLPEYLRADDEDELEGFQLKLPQGF